ncbi:ABC transporter ATP-binding protein [Candidatus Poribacteria bacterium]|nr:ABC transporter ATP-binding protein [Candidatus Poribacteria bacterium]MYG07289.1 ABC transporter ATP-binding protein [Candidatus Poribacteria bacterium]MYK22245.1 ABC transporter ATP-binding protein [Candidatus Poribacteria bacterium]
MAAIVEGIGLTKRFGTGDATVVAVDAVDIRIEESELVMLMGDSGCGKTTLISLLGCILTPDDGELRIDDEPIHTVSEDLSIIRREKIGFVFQLFHLLPYLTALENVMVAMDIASTKTDEAESRATELLTQVGLIDRLHHRPAQLSGGEKQRVSFARALANRPKIIFADEPTANLDSRQSDNLMNLIQELRREHQTTIAIVTHHEGLKKNADRVIQMKDGRIVTA